MIIVTGAAGFIGSCLVNKLNNKGLRDIVLVDSFSDYTKNKNLNHKTYAEKVERTEFFNWFSQHWHNIDFVFHLGARTDTTEFDKKVFDELNLNYSRQMWNACTEYQIPLLYASSAATYGLGELGYSDNHQIINKLKPLNPYGESKNDFDKWVLTQESHPPFWAGLKFFNVFGPNEYHKGRMASVVLHSYLQIKETGQMNLFRSHNPDYKDGMQLRDFIYVKDIVDICYFMMRNKLESGIYNAGTGKADSFLNLAKVVFKSMSVPENIKFIDTPQDIRDKYQYFTEADMSKLIAAGYSRPFYSLEKAVEDYVQNYLETGSYF